MNLIKYLNNTTQFEEDINVLITAMDIMINKADYPDERFKKEAIETKYWLQLLSKSSPELNDDCRKLWQEVHEFTLIFSKIIGTMSSNKK